MKNPTLESWRKSGAGGDGLGGAIGVCIGALFQDVIDGVIQSLVDSHHVHHRRGSIGLRQINPVEVVDVVALGVVSEKVVDYVLVRRSRTH